MGTEALLAHPVAAVVWVADVGTEPAQPLRHRDKARQQMGSVRFKAFDPEIEVWVAGLQDAMDQHEFDVASAEGSELSIADAIAYVQPGRGERKWPSSGWGSLTPTELDVVQPRCFVVDDDESSIGPPISGPLSTRSTYVGVDTCCQQTRPNKLHGGVCTREVRSRLL